jgi:triacylglycerol lipase
MIPLGLVEPVPPPSEPAAPGTPTLELRMEDVLASARRLWVRGQVIGCNPPTANGSPNGRWWGRWRRKAAPPPPQTLHLETRIGGHVLTAAVPLDSGGRFEATFPTGLTVARRGWRVARHRIALAGMAAEKCSLAVLPPEDAHEALVILLPLEYTRTADGPRQLARSDFAARLTPLLRQFQHGSRGYPAVYYLGCEPPDAGPQHRVELALAATTRGWPNGTFVLLPAEAPAAAVVLADGLDRLRWLFAGGLDLSLLNLEPTAAAAIAAREATEDRAAVRFLDGPTPGPWHGTAESVRRGLRPVRARLVTRHPIVFCHGMLALSTLRMQLPKELNYFTPLGDFLRERGFRVLFPQVSPTSGVAERARQLREQVRAWTDEPINIIAHSMGGLDARHLITHLGMSAQIRTLTTIATPHHGTYLADWFCAAYGQRVPLLTAFRALGVNMDGFRDCRLAACRAFNAATPNVPGVRYFSHGGEVSPARISPALRRAWNLLTPVEGPNDGMVSVTSARWGEYLGTLHADHFAQTPDAVLLHPSEDFDSLGFYARLVEDLARRGY